MVTKVAILHEGNAKKTNDNLLLKLLIENLALESDKVEFFGVGAKSNFFKKATNSYRLLLSRMDEGEISKVLFVVDADYEKNDQKYGGYKNTNDSLVNIISDLNLTSCADIYITCDPKNKEGYLESFILSTIPHEHKICIENFLSCSDFKSKENHKSILNHLYKIAYPNTPFDLSHKHFNELKQKLKKLFDQ